MVPLSFGCGSAVLAAIATLAPSRAARSAIASPMPRLPPDTNSVLPLSDVIVPPSRCFPPRAQVLLPGRFGATGTRIGGAEQSIWRHRDRIGRGLAERLDHPMALGAQGGQRLLGKTALDPHLIRQPLMMQARRRYRLGYIHAVIQHVDDHLQHRRD